MKSIPSSSITTIALSLGASAATPFKVNGTKLVFVSLAEEAWQETAQLLLADTSGEMAVLADGCGEMALLSDACVERALLAGGVVAVLLAEGVVELLVLLAESGVELLQREVVGTGSLLLDFLRCRGFEDMAGLATAGAGGLMMGRIRMVGETMSELLTLLDSGQTSLTSEYIVPFCVLIFNLRSPFEGGASFGDIGDGTINSLDASTVLGGAGKAIGTSGSGTT